MVPDAQLEKRMRRDFSPEYKLNILGEADGCKRGGLRGTCSPILGLLPPVTIDRNLWLRYDAETTGHDGPK